MRFIDPRIDFAFKKIFGSEDAKDILISFLESLLNLEGDRCIKELTLMDPFLAPRIKELKYSILDVKCKDHRGISYIVEMQVQKVSAFLKRIQYNAAKSYVHQVTRGDDYPKLNQIIAITITNFPLFEGFDHPVSHHESMETITGKTYLREILHCFIELPKFTKSLEELSDILDQWIYFIKYAGSLQSVPEQIRAESIRHAFERAMHANMSMEELELYENAGVAIADAQGALEVAKQEGHEIGHQEGHQEGGASLLLLFLTDKFDNLPDEIREKVLKANRADLEKWTLRVLKATTLDSVFEC